MAPPASALAGPSINRLFQHRAVSAFDAADDPAGHARHAAAARTQARRELRKKRALQLHSSSSSEDEGLARGQPRRRVNSAKARAAASSIISSVDGPSLGSPIHLTSRPPSSPVFAPQLRNHPWSPGHSGNGSSDLDAADEATLDSVRPILPLTKRLHLAHRRAHSFSQAREVRRPADSESSGCSSEDEVEVRAGSDADGEAESAESDIEWEIMPKDGGSPGRGTSLGASKPYNAEKRKIVWSPVPDANKVAKLTSEVKQARLSHWELQALVYQLGLADGSDVSMSDRESVLAHLTTGLELVSDGENRSKMDEDMLSMVDEMVESDNEASEMVTSDHEKGLAADRDTMTASDLEDTPRGARFDNSSRLASKVVQPVEPQLGGQRPLNMVSGDGTLSTLAQLLSEPPVDIAEGLPLFLRTDLPGGRAISFASKEAARQKRVHGVDLARTEWLGAQNFASMSFARLYTLRKRLARKARVPGYVLSPISEARVNISRPGSEVRTRRSAEDDIVARAERKRARDRAIAWNELCEYHGLSTAILVCRAAWSAGHQSFIADCESIRGAWGRPGPVVAAAEDQVESLLIDQAQSIPSSNGAAYDGSTPLIVFRHHARTHDATLEAFDALEPEAALRRARLHHLRAIDPHLRSVARRHEIAAMRATWQHARSARQAQAAREETERRQQTRVEAEWRYVEQARLEAAAEREAEEERWADAQRERVRRMREAQTVEESRAPLSALAGSSMQQVQEVSPPAQVSATLAIPQASPPMYQPPLLPSVYVRAASVPVQIVSSAVRAAGHAIWQASSPHRARLSLSPSATAEPSTHASRSEASRETSSSPEVVARTDPSPPATPPLPAYNVALYHPASPAPPPPYNAQSGYEVLEVDDLLGEVEDSDSEDGEEEREEEGRVPGGMQQGEEDRAGMCVVM